MYALCCKATALLCSSLSLSQFHSLSRTHTPTLQTPDTFLFRIHLHYATWSHCFNARCCTVSRAFFLLLACSFKWITLSARRAFLFCTFLSYVTSYVNCQATNTWTHTHTRALREQQRQRQRSRRQASPIQARKAFGRLSGSLSLSRSSRV